MGDLNLHCYNASQFFFDNWDSYLVDSGKIAISQIEVIGDPILD